MAETETGQPRPRPGSGNAGRVKARRCAVQALYQWQVAGATPETILAEFLNEREVDKVDVEYFAQLARDIPRQIAELAELQAALLARAIAWVKPGGRLVYAVCSLERAEGEAQAAGVALTPDPVRADELPAGLVPTPDRWVRTDPAMLAEAGGLDGFFIARWRV